MESTGKSVTLGISRVPSICRVRWELAEPGDPPCFNVVTFPHLVHPKVLRSCQLEYDRQPEGTCLPHRTPLLQFFFLGHLLGYNLTCPRRHTSDENICFIVFSFDTFQRERSWSKLAADFSIPSVLVSFDTSQPEMSWLKLVAYSNIFFIVVTLDVIHLEMSASKLLACWPVAPLSHEVVCVQ